MELISIKKKFNDYFKKYKFIALILLIGVFLMLFPRGGDAQSMPQEISEEVTSEYNEEIVLENILSKVAGAGRVEVMLTKLTETEYVYQTDVDSAISDSGNTSHIKTVIISEGAKNERGLIQKVNGPVYRGAVVVCDGGDDPQICLSIVDAVSKITGLSSNHIAVLKMD